MSLSNHNYNFICDKDKFYSENQDILNNIMGTKINGVYFAFDNFSNEWFRDAPVLIELNSGILSINVKSEKYVSMGINDISLHSKPMYFDEKERLEIDDWKEDLIWKKYDKVMNVIDNEILMINPILCEDNYGLFGIEITTSNDGCLKIFDNGDIIEARYVNYKYLFFKELQKMTMDRDINVSKEIDTFKENMIYSCYWYPLAKVKEDIPVLSTKSEVWDDKNNIQKLINIFSKMQVKEAIVVPELNNIYIARDFLSWISIKDIEDDTYDMPYYSEQFIFDNSKSWMIYTSHEGTITFAGEKLINEIMAETDKHLW